MFEVIGIECVARPATYSRREVNGITVHCFNHDVNIREGVAVCKFFFPNRSGKLNRASKLKLGDQIDNIYYDADKYPISFDLVEDDLEKK